MIRLDPDSPGKRISVAFYFPLPHRWPGPAATFLLRLTAHSQSTSALLLDRSTYPTPASRQTTSSTDAPTEFGTAGK